MFKRKLCNHQRPTINNNNDMCFPGGIMQCPSDISASTDVCCSGQLPSSDLFCHIHNLCLYSYPDMFLSQYTMFNTFLSSFVCMAASSSLPGC